VTDAPAKTPTRLWVRIARCAAVIFALPLLMLSLFQNKMLYFPDRGLPDLAQTSLKDVREVEFTASDGVKLVSWWRAPRPGQPTVIFCQGNAGNISDRSDRLYDAEESGWGLLLLGYRGYGKSEGSPHEDGIYKDTRAALEWVRQQAGVDPRRLVYWGESLGCAFASELATAQPPAAVVLEAPFRSLRAIASFHYPFLPTSILVRGDLDNVENVKKLRCPLTVIHGKRDEVVPFEHGRAVFEAAAGPKEFIELDSRHNDIAEIGGENLRARLRAWVEGVGR
jgi:hypothetical protein